MKRRLRFGRSVQGSAVKFIQSLIGYVFLFLACCHSVLADTIIVGGDHNFPPYEFINKKGQPDGYNTELTRAIAEVMGLDVKIQLGSWDTMKRHLENGDIDMLQGVSYSALRAQTMLFSPPHSLIHHSVFARKESHAKVSSLNDLVGKSVVLQRGGIMDEQLNVAALNAQLIYVDTHAAALRLLASGKYDYAFVANLPGLYLGETLALSNIEPVGNLFASQRYGFGVLKGHEELLSQFNQGLAILKNTGRQQQIYDKWFGAFTPARVDWQSITYWVAAIGSIVVLIFGVIIVWNRSLSQQVARRTEDLQIQQQQLIQADKMASLGILVSGVAHEINNPTSLLLLNLPVLQEFYHDADDILNDYYQQCDGFDIAGMDYQRLREELPIMLQDMVDGTRHIRRIVDDLRDFARQEAQDQQSTEINSLVDINDMVATSVRLTERTLRTSTENFRVDYYSQPLFCLGRAQRLQQVMINVIVNACQALEHPQQAIVISTGLLEDKLWIKVEDQGKGIDERDQARLFDPFFTTKREQGGTGLGLSISSAIVEEHQGQLAFYSVPGEGTEVTLWLPKHEKNGS